MPRVLGHAGFEDLIVDSTVVDSTVVGSAMQHPLPNPGFAVVTASWVQHALLVF